MMQVISQFLVAVEGSLAASLAVKATFVMLLALAFAFGPARRSRASIRHLSLAAAFAVLLMLPVAALLAPPVEIQVSVPVAKQQLVTVPPSIMMQAEQPVVMTAASVDARPRGMSGSEVLAAGWLCGMSLCLLPMAVGPWQLRSLRRTAIPWRTGQVAAQTIAHRAGLNRSVEVLLNDAVSGPTTYGIVRPVILLPVDAENWATEDLNRALVHELEHVRRADWMSHCLARVVCSVYWFHPLVWTMWRQFALAAERACDDAVLGSAEAVAYADQLVGLARRVSALRRSPGLAMASRADLSARVGAVLDGRQRRGRAGAWWVALASIAAALLVIAVSPLLIVAAPQAMNRQPSAMPEVIGLPAIGLPTVTPRVILAQLAPPNNNTPYAAPEATPPTLGSFSARTILVIIPVTVRDPNGKAVEGLNVNDFGLLEDGKKQAISIFEFQKIQNEPNSRAGGTQQQQQQQKIDDVMKKLEDLAKRQQDLARQQQQANPQQLAQQNYQLEMLRRETEQARQDVEKFPDTPSSYYVLGYYSTNSSTDGRFRTISVAVSNHFEVRHRLGYFADRPGFNPASFDPPASNTTFNGITSPAVISKVDPEYSEEARKAKYSGTVTLLVDIDTSGHVSRATVTRSLGMGLDEKAIEAVTKWRFVPAKDGGKPVDARSEVMVSFLLL